MPGETEEILAERKEIGHLWSRRDFLSLSGWAIIISMTTGSLIAFTRFMFPRVLFEPKTTFKAGSPDEYPVGTVSEKFKESQGVWIVRTGEGVYALLSKCTHLGCTPRWLEAENKYKCPCHGSGFYRDGINFEGPAPRALERAKISLSEEGELVIDKSVKFLYEKGEWEKSILKA
ncbi:MAG: Rieske (2Fe-2S) protein [Candidatus Schekmanbacteria bacterium GWA2_38_11]|uniref:Rieske (2Fe-2S) protein n=1 Tax=Candidatus Schekmanbacteria bacterium GWA2_38_11 TaxID=1817876 RepID=A0A1F7RBZ4_9BACT|nr:MAG: Rieske (2Fe-2S) protein [Candidatus Schekmanbacteria bacterium GWA2_38_11]